MYSVYPEFRRKACLSYGYKPKRNDMLYGKCEQKILMVVKDNEINRINGPTRFEYGN